MYIESMLPPTILSSVPLSPPALSFSQLRVFFNESVFDSGGQSIGVSASASVLPMTIQGWFPLELTGLIALLSKGLSRVFSSTIVQKYQFFGCSAFIMGQLSHPYVTTRKNTALTIWTFVGKVISLLYHTLSRFVIAFLPRSKYLLISWLQLPSAVILEPKKIKSVTMETDFPLFPHLFAIKWWDWVPRS